ncbi:MAG: hypothetical protein ABSA47_04300 [Verrucomicrobiota bacterium]|jgi:hypothetical protein
METEIDTGLLEPLETLVAPASTAAVVIGDFFKMNNGVKFASVFGEFKSRFFDKREKAVGEVTYRKYRLMGVSADGPIIAELGGESKVEGTVTAALRLLQRQGRGGPGYLQTNGYANIFYAKDKKGVLCAIRIGWAEDGWVLDALPVKDPVAWNGEHEIFCPVADCGGS